MMSENVEIKKSISLYLNLKTFTLLKGYPKFHHFFGCLYKLNHSQTLNEIYFLSFWYENTLWQLRFRTEGLQFSFFKYPNTFDPARLATVRDSAESSLAMAGQRWVKVKRCCRVIKILGLFISIFFHGETLLTYLWKKWVFELKEKTDVAFSWTA